MYSLLTFSSMLAVCLRICVCGVQCSAKVHVYLEAFVYGVRSSAKDQLHSRAGLACLPALLARGPAWEPAWVPAWRVSSMGCFLRSAPAQTLSTARLRSAPVWNTGIHSTVTSFQCIDCDTNQARRTLSLPSQTFSIWRLRSSPAAKTDMLTTS